MESIRKIIKKYGITPSRRLGQNFLIDKKVLRKIIRAADLKADDVVLEIGPGIGSITKELAKRAKEVIAVEKDPKITEALKENIKGAKNVKILTSDILKLRLSSLGLQRFKVVANIPYYLTSHLIRKLLEAENPAELIVLVIQKEVAQRICAKTPKMNLLAVSVQFYAQPEIVSYVSRNSFLPKPRVDSAIIKLKPRPLPNPLPKSNLNKFFKILKGGFSQPRKQLLNSLSQGLNLDKEIIRTWLLENGIQPSQRPESLKIKDWINLTRCCKLK